MKKQLLFSLIIICISFKAYSQPGTLDLSFDPGTGANNNVACIAIQNDEKILIGGTFTSYNGVSIGRGIARLNTDGSIDPSFNSGSGTNDFIYSIALQSDGKIIIAGDFTFYNGITRTRIARLNSDGSLDTSFDPGTGPDYSIMSISIQSDDKIIIGGAFHFYNGTSKNFITRLNADGSLDTGFNSGSGTDIPVYSTVIQSNGKILICGGFTLYNGISRNRIAGLNTDGSLDAGFDPGTGANTTVGDFAIQSDGKIIIIGLFSNYNGISSNGIARLNTNGSIDTGFNPGTGPNTLINCIAIQTDGKIIIGGQFTSFDGVSINRIALLNTNGSINTNFNPGTGANNTVGKMAILNDGKILIGGEYTSYDGKSRNYIARINSSISTSILPSISESLPLYIFPNPTEGISTIMSNYQTSSLEIYNNTGTMVYSKELINGNNALDLQHLPSGLYAIMVVHDNEIETAKIVLK